MAIASFLTQSSHYRGNRRSLLIPTRANGQPTFGCYVPDEHTQIFHPHGIMVLTMEGDRISAITRFIDGGLLLRFSLPRTLPGSGNISADQAGFLSSKPQGREAPAGPQRQRRRHRQIHCFGTLAAFQIRSRSHQRCLAIPGKRSGAYHENVACAIRATVTVRLRHAA